MQERAEFVSRETVMRDILCEPPDAHYPSWYAEKIAKIPAADVVTRDCYDRILAENDTMRNQLAEVGKKVGDEMDDVRPVVMAVWKTGHCTACGIDVGSRLDTWTNIQKFQFCPFCGADMSGT